ncbi:hypothetical protein [Dyella silvatica]|uniref:hypothetical protein n=1 Tax=Dyella silvatica TaxID=2992128 RepID=UPI002258C2CB|nr:hypothetical protein [Dyella silvatica]
MSKQTVWRIAGLALLLAGCTREAPACLPTSQSAAAAPHTNTLDYTVWITPEIRSDTHVQEDTQSAQVTFVSGSQVMLTIALSQGANSAIVDRGAAVGTARIDPGLRLDFQIATPLQRGAVYLDGHFASSNLPKVHYQGALATWSAPPQPPLTATKE